MQSINKQGLSQEQLEKIYQAELASCADPQTDNAKSACTAAANVDYFRLARMLVAGKLSAAEYLQRVRDRSRKLQLARRDETWMTACASGDDDGDLVPNDRDRCPKTYDLAPTDDYGCPSKAPLPKAPEAKDVLAILDKMGVAATPGCKEAAPPDLAEPIRAGIESTNLNNVLIAVTRVGNQPP